MKNFLLILSLCSSVRFARAGSEAHGGTAVVCFDGANHTNLYTYSGLPGTMMTPLGRSKIKSAVTLEWFRSELRATSNPLIQQTQPLDYHAAYELLAREFKKVPDFYNTLITQHDFIGFIADTGMPTQYGINLFPDSGNFLGFPENCALEQVAVRQADTVNYDLDIWNKLDGFQRALLQLHEEIYASQLDAQAARGSQPTQLLMMALLTQPLNELQLQEKIITYGFGTYMVRTEMLGLLKWVEANLHTVDADAAIVDADLAHPGSVSPGDAESAYQRVRTQLDALNGTGQMLLPNEWGRVLVTNSAALISLNEHYGYFCTNYHGYPSLADMQQNAPHQYLLVWEQLHQTLQTLHATYDP